MFLCHILCLTGPQFDVDLILYRTELAQGQPTDDLTRSDEVTQGPLRPSHCPCPNSYPNILPKQLPLSISQQTFIPRLVLKGG